MEEDRPRSPCGALPGGIAGAQLLSGRGACNQPSLVAMTRSLGYGRRVSAIKRFPGDVGAVVPGGVDEVDTEFDRPAQHPDALVAVGGRTPDPLTGQSHRAVAKPVDGQIVADGEGSRGRCDGLGAHLYEGTTAMPGSPGEVARSDFDAPDLPRGGCDGGHAARELRPSAGSAVIGRGRQGSRTPPTG